MNALQQQLSETKEKKRSSQHSYSSARPSLTPQTKSVTAVSLQILLLSGLCSCLHHYSLIKEPRTWFDAKKYCRTMYSDLAMVQSKDHMERLIAAAGSDYKGDVWLGLKDYPYRWHWSFRRPNWYSGNEYYFRNWATPQPPHMRRVPLLCTAFKDGLWEVISCTTQLSFVCYYIGYSFVRYVFVSTPKTWTEAELYCMKHYNNLVSVRSSHENTAVRNAVPVGVKAFIGLSRKPWSSWSSGSVTSFTYWALPPQVPNDGNCVASVFNHTHQGQWVESNCKKELHFMCYNNKEKVFKIQLKSAVDLNDPAVSAGILNTVKGKLKDSGITRDFRLKLTKYPEENKPKKEEDVPLLQTCPNIF